MDKLKKTEPRSVIISIKPEYAIKIIEGTKTIELRRKFPTENIKGGIAIIYASSPLKEIIGYSVIADVQKLPISEIWKTFSNEACVTKSFFNSYFKGLDEGFAISLQQTVKLSSPVHMKELGDDYSISVPQSYRYAPNSILEAIEG